VIKDYMPVDLKIKKFEESKDGTQKPNARTRSMEPRKPNARTRSSAT
jgi:hypothetical protein